MSAFILRSSTIVRRASSLISSSTHIQSRIGRGQKTPAIFTPLIKPSTFQILLPHEVNQRLYFSTNKEEESSYDSNDTKIQTENNKNNTILFPWRENAITPLPRIASNDDLSGFQKSSNYKFVLKLGSCVELGEFSLWSFFISKQWEKELALHTEWAFQAAVAGLISRTFGVPFDSIDNTEEDGVVVDLIVPNAAELAAVTETNDDSHDGNDSNERIDEDGESSKVEEDEKENDMETDDSVQFIEDMIEENLLSLYQYAFRNKDCTRTTTKGESSASPTDEKSEYEVTFCLKPLASRLENIFIVGLIARDDVKSNPSLKGAYSEINNSFHDTKSQSKLGQMAQELIRKTPHSGTKRSIIIDVSIDCAEIFQIKDLRSGEIIQGQGKGKSGGISSGSLEPEMTTHLVRLEMVTSKGKKAGQRDLGSWYVIDIDDQLNGNTWH